MGGAWDGAFHYESHIHNYACERLGAAALFLGSRSDVPALYQEMDVAVHPSHSENLGGALESLLAGVPTIATHVGGFPDLVHHGETGWLVPAEDPVKLAETILYVLRHPGTAHAAAQKGKLLARQLCNVKKCAAEIKAIYQTILSNN